MCRLTKLFLLIFFSFLLITACYQLDTQKSGSSIISPECRDVQHKFGETCVPLNPRRIVALDPRITLDPLLALGIKPVGYAAYGEKGNEVLLGVSLDKVKGSANVGSPDQASLEKVFMLKPDLILQADYRANQSYKIESAIAPTFPVPSEAHMVEIGLENETYFKYNLRYIAELVGQQAKVEEVINQYQKRTEELKKSLGNQLQQMEAAVIFYGEGYIWTISTGDIISSIFADIGLRHKSVAYGDWNISIETINKYDADILFIIDIDERTPSFYFQNPMFRTLKAVRNNRAYVVSQESWRGYGISGANKILDDLFKYLPEAQQNLQLQQS